MAFNYPKMQKLADKLLSKQKFGGPFVLKKKAGQRYDPDLKKQVSTYEEYQGNCVKKVYKDDGLGHLKDVLKAGDLEFVCTMKDINVFPDKNDQIVFEGVIYNVITPELVDPTGKLPLVHKCYARRA